MRIVRPFILSVNKFFVVPVRCEWLRTPGRVSIHAGLRGDGFINFDSVFLLYIAESEHSCGLAGFWGTARSYLSLVVAFAILTSTSLAPPGE